MSTPKIYIKRGNVALLCCMLIKGGQLYLEIQNDCSAQSFEMVSNKHNNWNKQKTNHDDGKLYWYTTASFLKKKLNKTLWIIGGTSYVKLCVLYGLLNRGLQCQQK